MHFLLYCNKQFYCTCNFSNSFLKCIFFSFKAGFGLFQYFLFFVLGLGLAADSVEVFVIAYVLPSAEKELCMDDSRKGWLGKYKLNIPYSNACFNYFSYSINCNFLHHLYSYRKLHLFFNRTF